MIFNNRCAGCGRRGPALCRTCRFALIGRPTGRGPDDVVVATAYTGRVRDVMVGLKYDNRRQVAAHLAGILANRVETLLSEGGTNVDVVTWAPTGAARRRRRGFDQAEMIARGVAARLGVPCRQLLERRGSEVAQTGRGRAERLHGPHFVAHPRSAHARVLLIDDVVTTGATLAAAARALRRAGAATVVPAAFAGTPGGLRSAQRVA